jgi:hypothetical protein
METTMAVPPDVLQALASTFSAVRMGPEVVQPGQPIQFRVIGADSGLTATDIVGADVSLAWITKDVRFNTFTSEPALSALPFTPASIDAVLAGEMPVRIPVLGNVVGTQTLPGVPGSLNQLAGRLPIPVAVPVKVEISWTVLDADGMTPLAEGPVTFSAPRGTTSSNLVLAFAPQIVELTNSVPVPVVRRFIRASVALTAGATVHAFDLPSIPLLVAAVPIPTVVVFFLHADFAPSSGDDDGAALIVVPSNSPLRSLEQLQGTLDALESTLSALTGIADLAALLLGLGELSAALAAQPHVQFRVADAIDNLNDITLISRAWYKNDTEAEDELSSMILLGPSRKTLQCFNDRHQDDGEGQFDLTVGSKLHALIRNLDGAAPPSGPDGSEITIVKAPPGGWFNPDDFNDELSSIRFA